MKGKNVKHGSLTEKSTDGTCRRNCRKKWMNSTRKNRTEELLDIMEVIYAIGEERGLSIEELEVKRLQKKKSGVALKRGFNYYR